MAEPNISLYGATYSGVKGVTLPKQGGGTATFPWVEGSETKTTNGTYDVTNLAELVVNVSGGGGGTIVSKSITANGTYDASADNADGYSPVTVNVPSMTLLGSATLTVNTTSTTASSAGTIACGSGAFTKDDVIFVHIRGQSGKRNGYFYGSDTIFINHQKANGSTTTFSAPAVEYIRVSSSGAYTTATGSYGVYGYSINSSGTVTIRQRYNSSNTLTINDKFDVYVYKLTLPNNLKLFT